MYVPTWPHPIIKNKEMPPYITYGKQLHFKNPSTYGLFVIDDFKRVLKSRKMNCSHSEIQLLLHKLEENKNVFFFYTLSGLSNKQINKRVHEYVCILFPQLHLEILCQHIHAIFIIFFTVSSPARLRHYSNCSLLGNASIA